MGEWRRHAIYFAPPAGSALQRFGNAWFSEAPAAWVAAPRRYGFHATLKAPFRLAAGRSVAELDAAVAAVAAGCAGFELRLRVASLGAFLALVPEAAPPALATLEAALVRELDAFRAPPSPAELARRRAAGLDAGEEENLARWGYPYVLDRFRFHMTLTGPGAPAGAELEARWPPADVPVRDVCRFSEGEDGNFVLVRRFALADKAAGGPT